MHEVARQTDSEQGKKPYSKPELVELGSVIELTRGAITAAASDDGRFLHS
jgi:hypothetical protein